ncbi:unnamed protein product [Acanthosepion pharaonis]|uniref:Uncharacterized protein n=1 Tax=Acanthosepion pharaonis TaxID=158019 RepID=A0A812DMR4_ACAPH|nr:unnamed protein product [Sepia pharaonis]
MSKYGGVPLPSLEFYLGLLLSPDQTRFLPVLYERFSPSLPEGRGGSSAFPAIPPGLSPPWSLDQTRPLRARRGLVQRPNFNYRSKFFLIVLLVCGCFRIWVRSFLSHRQRFGQQVAKMVQSLDFRKLYGVSADENFIYFLLETCLLLKVNPHLSAEFASWGLSFLLRLQWS